MEKSRQRYTTDRDGTMVNCRAAPKRGRNQQTVRFAACHRLVDCRGGALWIASSTRSDRDPGELMSGFSFRDSEIDTVKEKKSRPSRYCRGTGDRATARTHTQYLVSAVKRATGAERTKTRPAIPDFPRPACAE